MFLSSGANARTLAEIKHLKTTRENIIQGSMADKMPAQKTIEPKTAAPVLVQDSRERQKKELIVNNLNDLRKRFGKEYGFQISEAKTRELAAVLTPYVKYGLNKAVVDEIKNTDLENVVKRFYDRELNSLAKDLKKVKREKEAEKVVVYLKRNIEYLSRERDKTISAVIHYNTLLCPELDSWMNAVKEEEKNFRAKGIVSDFYLPPLYQRAEHLELIRLAGMVMALSGRIDKVDEITQKVKNGESIDLPELGLATRSYFVHVNPGRFPASGILSVLDSLDPASIEKLNKTRIGQPNDAFSYHYPDAITKYEEGAQNEALRKYFSEDSVKKAFESILKNGRVETLFDPGYGGIAKYTNKDGTPNQAGVLYEEVKLMQLLIFASVLGRVSEYKDPGALAGLARAALLMSTEHYSVLISAVGKEAEKGTLTVDRAKGIAEIVMFSIPYLLSRANQVIDEETERYVTSQKRSVSQEEAQFYKGFLQSTLPEIVLSLYKTAYEGGDTSLPVYGFGLVKGSTKSKSLIDRIIDGDPIPNKGQLEKLIMNDIKVTLKEQRVSAEIKSTKYDPLKRGWEVEGTLTPQGGLALKDLTNPAVFVFYQEKEALVPLFKELPFFKEYPLFKDVAIKKGRWLVPSEVKNSAFKAFVPGVYKHGEDTDIKFEAYPIGPDLSRLSEYGSHRSVLTSVPPLVIPNVGNVDVVHSVGMAVPGGSLTSLMQYFNQTKEEANDPATNPFMKNVELSKKLEEAGSKGAGFEWKATLGEIEKNQLEMLRMLRSSDRLASDFPGGANDPDYQYIMNWIDASLKQGKISADKKAMELLSKSNFGIQTGMLVFPEPFRVRTTISADIMEAGTFYEKGKWGLGVLKGDLKTNNKVTYKTVAYDEETGEAKISSFTREYETKTDLAGLSGRLEFDKLKGTAQALVDLNSPTAAYILRWLPSQQKDVITSAYNLFAKGWEGNLKAMGKKAVDLLALPPDVIGMSYIYHKDSGFSQMQFRVIPAPKLKLRGALWTLSDWVTGGRIKLDIPTTLTYAQIITRMPNEAEGVNELELSHELRADVQLWRSITPYVYTQSKNLEDLFGNGNVVGAGIGFDIPRTGLNVAVGAQLTDVEGKKMPNYVARLTWTFGKSEGKVKK
jgi:hypothetical protein